MLLSEKELGLSDDASGLFILPANAGNGAPLAGTLEITDWVLDVNVPPNRGDCQSVLGHGEGGGRHIRLACYAA